MLQDAANVGEESHVEHPVRLVENEDLQVRELGVGKPKVVQQAARRRDDHVDTDAKRVLLGAHGDSSENGGA